MKQMFFLQFSCFFYDPTDVGNLISGSSTFSKSSLNLWKFSVHELLKLGLENFDHYFARMWNECNCVVVWTFFSIALLWKTALFLLVWRVFRTQNTPSTITSCFLCTYHELDLIKLPSKLATFLSLIWKRSVFIPIPKKSNVIEYSNYRVIALISHANKVMLKILQARLQQYMNCELPDVQAG